MALLWKVLGHICKVTTAAKGAQLPIPSAVGLKLRGSEQTGRATSPDPESPDPESPDPDSPDPDSPDHS